MDCFCDYEPASIYNATRVKAARKEHRCYECARTIKPGESYESVFAVWEGEAQTVCTCSHCLDLREWVKAHVPCFCIGHGNVREDALETARGWAHEAPGLLFGAYRREVQIRRARNTKELRP